MAAAEAIRATLEARLAATVSSIRPVAGGDINDAFRIETGDGPLFVKTSAAAAPGTFAEEAAGLAWLGEPGGLPVPGVVLVHDPESDQPDEATAGGPGDDGHVTRFLALEWVERGPATAASDEALGRGLACVHGAGAPSFGATPRGDHAPMRFADLALPNDPGDTFAEFYAQRRILPLAEASHRRGHLSSDGLALMHRVAERMPQLAGPEEPPARTHGDLWSGNVFVDHAGAPHLIDPAAHGGHREVDLATLRIFGGPSRRAYEAYAEVAPLAGGHEERVPLFQLNTILLHVALFGGGYEQQAIAIARRYA